jgi:hypothetical protein
MRDSHSPNARFVFRVPPVLFPRKFFLVRLRDENTGISDFELRTSNPALSIRLVRQSTLIKESEIRKFTIRIRYVSISKHPVSD